MAKQNISTGSSANDGTGDTLRSAAEKINENFAELYTRLGGDSNNLSTGISFSDSAVIFEGTTADNFETQLLASDPTKDNIITLPDSSGEVVITTAAQTVRRKTLGSLSFVGNDMTANGLVDSDATFIVGNKSTLLEVTLGDGGTHGETKYFANRDPGNMKITPNNFALGNSFILKQNAAIQCIWDSGDTGTIGGGKWFLLGFDSATTNFIIIN